MEINQNSKEILNLIFSSLQESGYDPVEQLSAYLESGDIRYITRKNEARNLIQKVRKEEIEDFIRRYIV